MWKPHISSATTTADKENGTTTQQQQQQQQARPYTQLGGDGGMLTRSGAKAVEKRTFDQKQ